MMHFFRKHNRDMQEHKNRDGSDCLQSRIPDSDKKNRDDSPFRMSGFTLVELLMALFVSSVIMTVTAAMFARSLGLQRTGFFAQKVQENTMFILERMAKEVRVSDIGLASERGDMGTNADGCGNASVRIQHPINGYVTYAYDAAGKHITRQQDDEGLTAVQINSDDVQFNRVQFCIAGASKNDKQQVRLTTVMQMQARDDRTPAVIVFNIQTTVTSRNIVTEFQY